MHHRKHMSVHMHHRKHMGVYICIIENTWERTYAAQETQRSVYICSTGRCLLALHVPLISFSGRIVLNIKLHTQRCKCVCVKCETTS